MLRKRLLSLLRKQKEEDRVKKSRLIKDRLFASPEFQRSRAILFYASFDGEVETFEMIEQAQGLGKTIALPTIRKDQREIVPAYVEDLKNLEDGPFGIKEPSPALKSTGVKKIDLVVVPGVAFDRHNYRLGRGAGYYDRFLRDLPASVPSIGLAFDFQMVDSLPELREHDIPVSRVIVN